MCILLFLQFSISDLDWLTTITHTHISLLFHPPGCRIICCKISIQYSHNYDRLYMTSIIHS